MSRRDFVAPSPRSQWRKRSAPDVTVRVMGVVEGYVVFRRPGAYPALQYAAEWDAIYEPVMSLVEGPGPLMESGTAPSVRDSHDEAMRAIDRALIAKERGDDHGYSAAVCAAFAQEAEAVERAFRSETSERTKAILTRSALAMAHEALASLRRSSVPR